MLSVKNVKHSDEYWQTVSFFSISVFFKCAQFWPCEFKKLKSTLPLSGVYSVTCVQQPLEALGQVCRKEVMFSRDLPLTWETSQIE